MTGFHFLAVADIGWLFTKPSALSPKAYNWTISFYLSLGKVAVWLDSGQWDVTGFLKRSRSNMVHTNLPHCSPTFFFLLWPSWKPMSNLLELQGGTNNPDLTLQALLTFRVLSHQRRGGHWEVVAGRETIADCSTSLPIVSSWGLS